MQTKQKTRTVAVSLGTLAGVLVFSLLATAGNLDPNGPPAPTMRSLDEIYDAVNEASCAVAERDGYFESKEVAPYTAQPFFTVALLYGGTWQAICSFEAVSIHDHHVF
jgi:hypothetical protein